jgi:hypothetical protein
MTNALQKEVKILNIRECPKESPRLRPTIFRLLSSGRSCSLSVQKTQVITPRKKASNGKAMKTKGPPRQDKLPSRHEHMPTKYGETMPHKREGAAYPLVDYLLLRQKNSPPLDNRPLTMRYAVTLLIPVWSIAVIALTPVCSIAVTVLIPVCSKAKQREHKRAERPTS